MNNKMLIAMSGGVDSSVAALLMKNEGYDCIGATMMLHSFADTTDAKKIADKLSMPFYALDYTSEFRKCVIDEFVRAYEEGKTPNPCVYCNKNLKFGELIKKMKELDANYIATGHYARVDFDEEKGRYILKKAVDDSKDQSYVLYMLTQEQLSHIKFPLGGYSKPQIREIAEQNGFVNAHKKDSQDICFIPDGDYAGFIERYINKPFPKGEFVGKDGKSFGKHKGIIHYTIGQRKGLGIAYTKPLYVCEINPETNQVILGDNEDLFTDEVIANDVNIISKPDLHEPMEVYAKVRYRHIAQPAVAYQSDDGLLHVKFHEPQRAVTKGQSVVLYDGDIVVGGGTII